MRFPAWARGSQLLALFGLLCLSPFVLVAGAYSHDQHEYNEQLLARARAYGEDLGEGVFSPAIKDTRPQDGLSAEDRQRLRSVTSIDFYQRPLVGVRVLSPSGMVLFSEDGRMAVLPVDQGRVSVAAAGTSTSTVIDIDNQSSAINVLVPVGADVNGAAVAVLELQMPRATVAESVPSVPSSRYWGILAGSVCFFGLLLVLAWSSLRRLRQEIVQHHHEALHDDLTGLPNRTSFRQRLEDLTWSREPMALVIVDIDRFKGINDTLGHEAGDALLVEAARRLTYALRTDDVVARLGGDEFGLLLSGVADPQAAHELVGRAWRDLTAEWQWGDTTWTVEASFGVALFPRHALDTESLLKCADHAMAQAKRGTDSLVIFADGRLVVPSYQLSTQAAMRRALDNTELRLHYQPQIDLRTGHVRGVEALLRWQHPSRGLLAPGDFLDAVEQTGLIEPLTQWVVDTALADCAQWIAGGQDWDVAVNVSARNLDSPGFADTVVEALRRHQLSSTRLRVEVTETALAIDLDAATTTLERLSAHGVGIALDDFGVGYASLAHLRSLPLTELKIDRGFVQDVGRSHQDEEVVRSLIGLAHGLGLRVTAEGVESASTADWLRTSGCDDAQGYYFARPAPWRELVQQTAGGWVLLAQGGVPADEALQAPA